ncbi:MAG: VanZ family protein [Erysipelotrichales bacterium]|nr:VanZ family protein [Erysipelotrichales bacterium]
MKHTLVDTLKYVFIIYCIIMLGLLFNRTPATMGYSYAEVLELNLNLVPFKTIMLYINILLNPANLYLLEVAVVNLVGNLIVFIPLGLFLPLFWKRCHSFAWTMFYAVMTIVTVEVLQLFTLRGSCDIDDLILNVIGVSIGYVCFHVGKHAHRKHQVKMFHN